jgi:hypothetical protein
MPQPTFSGVLGEGCERFVSIRVDASTAAVQATSFEYRERQQADIRQLVQPNCIISLWLRARPFLRL